MSVALGLDEAAFNDCFESDRYRAEVNADLAEGQGRTVTSTPTFFVNDQKYLGVLSFEELQQLINAEVGR